MRGIPSLKPVGLVDQVYLKGKQNNVLPAGSTSLTLGPSTKVNRRAHVSSHNATARPYQSIKLQNQIQWEQ